MRSLDDLARLPFTRKTDLRDHYPFGLVAVPQVELARIHCSSGTTGQPTVVGYTSGDVELFAEVNARSLAMAGAEPGMMLHNAYGYGLFTGGLGLHYGAERPTHWAALSARGVAAHGTTVKNTHSRGTDSSATNSSALRARRSISF